MDAAGGEYYSLGLHSYSQSVGDDDPVQELFSIISIYPNPFISTVSMTLQSPGLENVRLEVFNTAGQLVSSKEMGAMAEGKHIVSWDVCGTSGLNLSSGIYIIRIVSGYGDFASAQVILLR